MRSTTGRWVFFAGLSSHTPLRIGSRRSNYGIDASPRFTRSATRLKREGVNLSRKDGFGSCSWSGKTVAGCSWNRPSWAR